MAKLYIDKWDRNLLLNSKIIDDYPDLKNLLKSNEIVSEKMVNDCTDMSISTQEIFISGVHRDILSMAEKEWVGLENSETDNSGEVNCALCNRQLKNIFFIRNIENQLELTVGSNCILHFKDLKDENGTDIAMYIESLRKQKIEEKKRTKRKQSFSLEFPTLDKMLDVYYREIFNSPYIVNYELYKQCTSLIEQTRSIKEKYITGKLTKSCFLDIKTKRRQIDRIVYNDIPRHIKKLSKNKYACTKEIVDWINHSNHKNKELLIEKIRKDGSCFTSDTIREISYLPFIIEHLEDYKEKAKDIFYDIRLVSEGGLSKLYVNIKNKFMGKITFCCTPNVFMKKFGDIVFLDKKGCNEKFSLNYLFTDFLLLYDDEDNIYRLYKKLKYMIEWQYEFLYDYDLNITYIINQVTGKYTKFNGTKRIVAEILPCFKNKNLINNAYLEMCKSRLSKNFKWSKITDSVIDDIKKCRREFNNTEYV